MKIRAAIYLRNACVGMYRVRPCRHRCRKRMQAACLPIHCRHKLCCGLSPERTKRAIKQRAKYNEQPVRVPCGKNVPAAVYFGRSGRMVQTRKVLVEKHRRVSAMAASQGLQVLSSCCAMAVTGMLPQNPAPPCHHFVRQTGRAKPSRMIRHFAPMPDNHNNKHPCPHPFRQRSVLPLHQHVRMSY